MDYTHALLNTSVSIIILEQDIVLTEEHWQALGSLPFAIARNVTIMGPPDLGRAVLLDARYVANKLQLMPGVVWRMERVLLAGSQRLRQVVMMGADFLAPSPDPQPGQRRAVTEIYDSFLFYPLCLPPDSMLKALQLIRRPSEVPGPQRVAVKPAGACTNVTWPCAADGPTCAAAESGLCAVDFAAEGATAGANSLVSRAGYNLHAHNTVLLCDAMLGADCVKKQGVLACYAAFAANAGNGSRSVTLESSVLQPGAGAGSGRGGSGAGTGSQPEAAHPADEPSMHQVQGPDGGAPAPTGGPQSGQEGQQVQGAAPSGGSQPAAPQPPEVPLSSPQSGGGSGSGEGPDLAAVLPAALGGAAAVVLLAAAAFLWRRRVSHYTVARRWSDASDGKGSQRSSSNGLYACSARGFKSSTSGAQAPGLPLCMTSSCRAQSQRLEPPGGAGLACGAPASPVCRMAGANTSITHSSSAAGASSNASCALARDVLTMVTPWALPLPDIHLGLRWGTDIVVDQDALLGAGSFGRVLQGSMMGRKVAVKLMHAQHGGGMPSRVVRQWQQEVQVLSRCRHRNVVALLGACLTLPHVCLVMELMDQSLEHLIHQDEQQDQEPRALLPLEQVLSIATDVAQGLAYLHPTVVHRDLKPANVLLDGDGTAKLSDFGLARLRSTVAATMHPEAGTVPYMPPECFDPTNLVITHKADIYSFGVLVWEMLTGQRPWSGLHHLQIAYAVTAFGKRLPMHGLSELRCPPRMAKLLADCWAHDPAARPSADEVVKRLVLVQEQAAHAHEDPSWAALQQDALRTDGNLTPYLYADIKRQFSMGAGVGGPADPAHVLADNAAGDANPMISICLMPEPIQLSALSALPPALRSSLAFRSSQALSFGASTLAEVEVRSFPMPPMAPGAVHQLQQRRDQEDVRACWPRSADELGGIAEGGSALSVDLVMLRPSQMT